MKVRQYPTMRSTLLACCLAAALTAAHASGTGATTTTTTSGTSTTTTAVGTSATTEARLSSEFAGFLGGEAQAGTVVSGLRQGTTFSLESGSGGSGTTTIDPPTGTMGYGNVRIALRLAQAELGQFGITQPTSAELSAVLLGGEINGTQVDGILSLRAEGMGWGQIARQYGTTVGQLMGQGAGLNRQAPTAATSSRTHLPGKASGTSASQARANGYIPSGGGSAHGSGMVTASGDSVGGAAYGAGKGPANRSAGRSQDAGVVSAGGQHASLSGVGNAGGGSRAQAPGQARNN
jgi:hypothetical protein